MFTSNGNRGLMICLDFLVAGKLYGLANIQCLLSLNLLLYYDIRASFAWGTRSMLLVSYRL